MMKLKFSTSLFSGILAGICGSSFYGAVGIGVGSGMLAVAASGVKYLLGDKITKVEDYVNREISNGIQFLSGGYIDKERSDAVSKGLTTAVEYGINFLASYKFSKFLSGKGLGKVGGKRIMRFLGSHLEMTMIFFVISTSGEI